MLLALSKGLVDASACAQELVKVLPQKTNEHGLSVWLYTEERQKTWMTRKQKVELKTATAVTPEFLEETAGCHGAGADNRLCW